MVVVRWILWVPRIFHSEVQLCLSSASSQVVGSFWDKSPPTHFTPNFGLLGVSSVDLSLDYFSLWLLATALWGAHSATNISSSFGGWLPRGLVFLGLLQSLGEWERARYGQQSNAMVVMWGKMRSTFSQFFCIFDNLGHTQETKSLC